VKYCSRVAFIFVISFSVP